MIEKRRELILNNLIDIYLKELSPVASTQLKRECELPFSPSTIRNYFKQLSEEGLIIRVHISSGSIPSEEAMQNYWNENLNFESITIDKDFEFIDSVSKEFGIFSMIKFDKNSVLKEVLNFNNSFIVLVINDNEIVLKYEDEIFNFLTQFKGYEIRNLVKILKRFNLNEVIDKLNSLNDVYLFNKEFLYENYRDLEVENFLNSKIFAYLDNKIVYNSDYLLYNTDVSYKNEKAEFLCVGNLYTNYEKFFQILRKGGVEE